MHQEFTDRHRSSRLYPKNRPIVALHVSVPVRVLGLDSDEVTMACEVPLRVGSTVRVVTELAGRHLETELCVEHVSNRPDERVGGYLLSGRIPSFNPTSLRTASVPLVEPMRAAG